MRGELESTRISLLPPGRYVELKRPWATRVFGREAPERMNKTKSTGAALERERESFCSPGVETHKLNKNHSLNVPEPHLTLNSIAWLRAMGNGIATGYCDKFYSREHRNSQFQIKVHCAPYIYASAPSAGRFGSARYSWWNIVAP